MPQIPISEIHDDPVTNVRRVAAGAAADEALAASVRAQGVLQPIVLRPNGNGYKIVFGRRRLRAALAAGLTEIPAVVMPMTDTWAIAADAAENMVRRPLHPLDQWRAVAALQAGGMPIPEAASALGLDERQTRRMDRLGRLHPDVLALVEHGMPPDRTLAIVALASPTAQAKAVKAPRAVVRAKGKIVAIDWYGIAGALNDVRMRRADALFDTAASGLVWDEDLFAEPGAENQFTTKDIAGFRRLQTKALEAIVAERRKKKQDVRILEIDPKNGNDPVLPKGFTAKWDEDTLLPRAGRTVFAWIDHTGAIRYRTAVADATPAKGAKAPKPAPTEGTGPDPGDDAADVKAPFTKAGLAMIADAKTAALGRALAEVDVAAATAPAQAMQMLLLALSATNVEIRHAAGQRRWRQDLAAKLLLPGGVAATLPTTDLVKLANEALAALLTVGAPDAPRYGPASGDAAEWIGAAVSADRALPRFDTPEFLATVKGAELKRLVAGIGLNVGASVSTFRTMLVGKLPDWRPCAFGAPVPLHLAADADGDAPDEEDAA